VVAAGGGDVGVAVQAQQADGQAAQRCHDAGCVPGPDQGLVLLVGDVADPVELVFYLPVTADPGREGGGVGSGVAGAEVDDLDGLLAFLRDGPADLRTPGRGFPGSRGRGRRLPSNTASPRVPPELTAPPPADRPFTCRKKVRISVKQPSWADLCTVVASRRRGTPSRP
jgi:hypothetical protein